MKFESWDQKKISLLIVTFGVVLISIFYLLLKLKLHSGIISHSNLVSVDEVFPGKPWRNVLPHMKPVDGVEGVKASDCGTCHTEIYEEWKTSTHSQAFHDLQFQSEISKDPNVKWVCLNCHIPVQNQREGMLVGLEDGNFRKPVFTPNPDFDPDMQKEGVTCATCHIRRDEKGESVVIGSIGGTSPPHPVVIDRDHLRSRCQDCHNQVYNLDPTLVCYFKTGEEMEASEHLAKDEKFCSSCHLPEVKRSLVKKGLNKPMRTAHRHNFWGGPVPKNFELYESLKYNGYKSAFKISNLRVDMPKVRFQVENTNSAHYLPSGDPERHILLEVSLVEKINTDKKFDNILAQTTYKIGQDWEWWPKAELKQDNRLKPKEKREIELNLKSEKNSDINLDSGKIPNAKIRITATYVRVTEENAKSMKANYKNVASEYADKVKDLEKHYPFSTKIWEMEYDFATKKILP